MESAEAGGPATTREPATAAIVNIFMIFSPF
jgi:hypothetical protein